MSATNKPRKRGMWVERQPLPISPDVEFQSIEYVDYEITAAGVAAATPRTPLFNAVTPNTKIFFLRYLGCQAMTAAGAQIEALVNYFWLYKGSPFMQGWNVVAGAYQTVPFHNYRIGTLGAPKSINMLLLPNESIGMDYQTLAIGAAVDITVRVIGEFYPHTYYDLIKER